MGEVAEMMLDGTLCEGCGVFLNENAPGHPCHCHDCAGESKAEQKTQRINAHHKQQAAQKKVSCSTCGRRVKATGLADHVRDAHPPVAQAAPAPVDPRAKYKPEFEKWAGLDGTYHLAQGTWRMTSNGGVPVVDFYRPYKQDRTMHTFEGFIAGLKVGSVNLIEALREIAKHDSSEGLIASRALALAGAA